MAPLQFKRNFRLMLLVCLITIGFLVIVRYDYRAHSPITTEIRQRTEVADLLEASAIFQKILMEPLIQPSNASAQPQFVPIEPQENDSPQNDMRDLVEGRDLVAGATPVAPTWSQRLLQPILKCKNRELIMEKQQYGSYWLVRNFIRGSFSRNVGCAETITYTTNGDYTFFGSLAMVVSRWLAPVSFAIFAPGYDINATMDSITYVRQCLPESDLIRKYVTFHIYFPADHMPAKIPLTEQEATDWEYDCDGLKQAPPFENIDRKQMYKTVHNLTYPINVGRNIARYAANTYFIFACDIELFPSVGLVDQFLEMVARNPSEIVGGDKLRVFVLPVFEMQKNLTIPKNKTELVQLLRRKKAIPFHAHACGNCHLVPKQAEWVNTTDRAEMSILTTSKREGKFRFWEPFYISNNREPMFDERVTWEGQSNKRIQGYAMCLLGYDYQILHPAFLMHSPGIKYFNKNSSRLAYVPPMNRLIKSTIMPEYRILYGKNRLCNT